MSPPHASGKKKKTKRRSHSVERSTKEYGSPPVANTAEYSKPPKKVQSVVVAPGLSLPLPRLSETSEDRHEDTDDDEQDVVIGTASAEDIAFVRIEDANESPVENIPRKSSLSNRTVAGYTDNDGAVGGTSADRNSDQHGSIVVSISNDISNVDSIASRIDNSSVGAIAKTNAYSQSTRDADSEVAKHTEMVEAFAPNRNVEVRHTTVRDSSSIQSIRGGHRRPLRTLSPPRLTVSPTLAANPALFDYLQDRSTVTNDRRQMYINGLERLWTNTQSPNFQYLKVQQINVQIDTANRYWTDFLKEHCDAFTTAATPQERSAVNSLHSRIESLHEQIVTTLTIRVDELTAEARRAERPEQPTNRQNQHLDSTVSELRMRAVKMESFSGDYMSWTVFKSFFENYYHLSTITDSMKMYMLRSYLVPNSEPYNLISGFEPTAENYHVAWRLLCDVYDDERKILEAHFLAFLDMPRVDQNPTRRALMELVTKTRTLINSMPKYNVDTSHWGVCIVPILARKLDNATRADWNMKRPPKVKPEIEPFLQYLARRAEGIDPSYTGNRPEYRRNNQTQGNAASNTASNATNVTATSSASPQQLSNREIKRKCPDPLCRAPNNKHQLYRCPRFQSLELEGRRRKVHALGVCNSCLRKQCEQGRCPYKPCQVCNERHNSWLCPQQARPPVPMPAHITIPLTAIATSLNLTKNSECIRSSENTMWNDTGERTLLATAVITIRDSNGIPISFRALLDSGSHINVITTDALQRLRLARPSSPTTFHGIGGKESVAFGIVNVEFASRFNGKNQFSMSALIIKKITSRLPQQQFSIDSWVHLRDLPLADPDYNIPSGIDVLLGASVYSDIVKPGLKRGGKDEPVAQCTRIGWIVYGKTDVATTYMDTLHAIADMSKDMDETNVEELLSRYWQIENVPERRVRSKEEQFCEQHFVNNTFRDETGRYVVKIPFDPSANDLGDSRAIALRRLLQMEQRFIKSPQLKDQYVNFMREYEELGHMRLAEPLPKGSPGCFIPHHAAGTAKFRVVFDGSCRTSNGVSLNDIQLTGEKLQPDLTSTTMRFRTHKYALTADIKKMYRQVKVHDSQLDFQRILWREDSSWPLREYQLTTQTYGLRSAPHNCVRALKQCALDYESEHPLASEIAQRDFYIDDLITGADTATEAMNIRDEMTKMMLKGGFELAKWMSNSAYVRVNICPDEVAKAVVMDNGDETENSVLGLKWLPSKDVFKYTISVPKAEEKITKRKIVSYVAQLYDPNGYLSAVTVLAKILIQKLWIAGCSWDGKVPQAVLDEWALFIGDLPKLSEIQIPRWIGMGPNAKAELHGFSDASNQAYGCVFYIKTIGKNGSAKVNLVMSRTRVAPIKRTTIPRMELCGAHLMTKLLREVREVHNIDVVDCHLWTDSMIVLHWLQKTPTNAKVFVANRVSETSELSEGCSWHHVPTKDNPADLASRGLSPSSIVDDSLWWHGPEWLLQPSTEWPKSSIAIDENTKALIAPEMEKKVSFLTTKREPFLSNAKGELLEQYSNVTKLYRVTAWVMRFINNCRSKTARRVDQLTTDEIIDAEYGWVRRVQQTHFSEELACLTDPTRPKPLPKGSKLIGLRPFKDGSDGLLRCSGRLDNAALPYDAVKPIVLSADSRLTKLIIESAHKKMLHGGTQATMQYVRNKFWIPKMRSITRSVIHRCIRCVRHDAQPMTQLMGSLPKARTTPGKGFQKTGVDYCGPFYLKARTGRCKTVVKAYVAVFVCMATKAVHLELVSDLTSEAFIAALTRLTSRRGRVQELYSDNGTTFHGADKELTNAIKSWKKLSSEDMFQDFNIKWSFIPPVAPHHGGLWEAAVKSAKNHLKRVVGEQWLTFEELATVLSSVEACLNSRPIGRPSDDNADNLALTPGDLLGTGSPMIPLSRDHSTTPKCQLRRWKLLERLKQDFWQRWQHECLDQMLARSKWKVDQRNAAKDDIVLVRSDNTPPTQWPLGRIVETYPGPDGLVRSVDVIMKGKTYRRPIVKLVLLPTDVDTS